jgi:iron complex transport system substrate-binding protein
MTPVAPGLAPRLLACVAGLALAGAAAGGQPLADDRGRMMHLARPAQRIVTLAPGLTELAFAAGAGDRLAGVSAWSDYPEAARRLPRVGDAARLDAERILLLGPDLLLAWRSGNPAGEVARLERLGLPVFALEPARLADVPRVLRTIGALAGTEAAAERAAAGFEAEMEALRSRYGARPRVAVFYEIWDEPLLTVNREHIISDVIALCGGRNVFADAPLLTPAVSPESLLAADPDVIVASLSTDNAAAARKLRKVPSLRAAARGRVFVVPPDLIQRATPRIIEGARQVCEALEHARRAPEGSSYKGQGSRNGNE